MKQEDRDMLIRMDQNLKNLIDAVSSHVQADMTSFKKSDDKIDFHSKIIYGLLGIIAAIDLISRFIR